MSDLIKCKVMVEKVFFPKNGKSIAGQWASFSCKVIKVIEGEPKINKKYDTISCNGKNIPKFDYSEVYTLYAREKMDEKWGCQYEVLSMGTEYNFSSEEDQKTFFSFILTEKQIDLLYKSLPDPFSVIKRKDITTLTKINGIGPKKAMAIIEKFEENEINGPVYVELASYGLTKGAIDKLINVFGMYRVVDIIREDPYQLIGLVSGYGWKRTDAMALNNGMENFDVRRIAGFIKYFLCERENEGNSYTEPQHLFEAINEQIVGPPTENVKEAMHKLFEDKIIWWDETKEKIFLLNTINLEKNISEELNRIQSAPSEITYRAMEEILTDIEQKNGWEFTDEQKEAVLNTLKSNVSIITGGAGVGKSSVVSAILQCCENVTFAQTALAGRAAARLSEVTGEDGFTIHRLLGMKEGKFIYNKTNPLHYDLIILDEVSMIGGGIFYSLISAIKDGAKLIMLGDIGQLEAIGVLNLFRDMLDSDRITINHLTKIHRQAAKSAIITTSMHVRNQEQLFKKGFTGSEIRGDLQDLELDIYEDSAVSQRKIVRHFKSLVQKDIDPNDIQVIVPMKTRGEISTFVLNPLLKQIANPEATDTIECSKMIGGIKRTYTLSVGDKVINIANNYKTINEEGVTTPVYNGNMGIIKSIEDTVIVVDFFQWGSILIPKSLIETIELAYAITCHKIQGSQSPFVIIGLDTSAYMMLSKEWLYTAITRTQNYCILCGQSDSIRMAISTSKVPEKQTMLRPFIDGEYNLSIIPPARQNFSLNDYD